MVRDILIINNFLSPSECNFYKEYIDTNLGKFLITDKTKRYGLLFGKDIAHDGKSLAGLTIISDIEDNVKKIFRRLEIVVKKSFSVQKELYVCSFHMAKQVEGSFIKEHYDTDGGVSMHIEYGGVIYLNSMTQSNSGKLKFSRLGYEYTPVAGDLVIFPSQDPIYSHEVTEIHEDRYNLPIWTTTDPEWAIK